MLNVYEIYASIDGETTLAGWPVVFIRLAGCRHGITINADYKGSEKTVAVYNSLHCSSIPEQLEVFAEFKGVPMALRHKELPLAGVQFHPESFMTQDGGEILKDVFSSIGIL